MAAELVLTPVINKAVEIAGNLILEEASRLYWLKRDIDWLHEQLNFMQSYLEDAQAKQAGDLRVATLIKHIELLALDVEDLLETYLPQMQSHKGTGQFGWLKNVACIFSYGHNAHKFAMEIEKIKKRVEEIDRARTTYGITDTGGSREGNNEGISRRSILHADEPEIIGQDKNAKKLEAKLLDTSVEYAVISIVGMPGLGKTTLAKRIYNRVKDRFDCSALGYVSQEPNVGELLQSIARQVGIVEKLKEQQKQLNGQKQMQKRLQTELEKLKEKRLEKQLDAIEELEELEKQVEQQEKQLKELEKQLDELEKQPKLLEDLQLEGLQHGLRSILKERRYLILLDDIWENATWDDLNSIFPSNPKIGSRIIITSRKSNIGRYIGGESSLHVLEPLNVEDSMKLFWKSVIALQVNTYYSPDLEDIGRKIGEKCGGVPLAIVLTAGMLRAREKTERQWILVLKSMGHNKQDECSKILALSYKDLPSKLKPCFLYLGLFPEDYEIPAFRLINMWVAEKFIRANGEQEPEEVGEDYLNDLVARNLVQVAERGYDGRIKSCRIHDLLHGLCTTVAQENNFFHSLDTLEKLDTNSAMNIRRLTTHLRSIDEYIALNLRMPKLRALLCFAEIQQVKEQHRRIIFGECRFLRVLSIVVRGYLKSIPSEIRYLSLLSYLEVDGPFSWISRLNKLQNLQSIYVKAKDADSCIWKMKQLRHLSCIMTDICRSFPTEVCLPNLQTLDIRIFIWYPEMLFLFHKLPSLRRLRVRGQVEPIIEALSGTTSMIPKIEILKLDSIFPNALKIIVNLACYTNLVCLHLCHKLVKLPNPDEFPPNLIKLTLRQSHLREDPMKTLGSLAKLKILKLCENSYLGRRTYFSGLDSFPHLKLLLLRGLESLQEVIVEDGVLAKLEIVVIEDCPAFKKIPERLQHITKMTKHKGTISSETEI